MLCAADLVCSVALLRDRLVFQVKYAWCKTRTNSNVKSLHHHSTIHRLKIWKLEKLLKLDWLSVSQLFGKWFRFAMCICNWIVYPNDVFLEFPFGNFCDKTGPVYCLLSNIVPKHWKAAVRYSGFFFENSKSGPKCSNTIVWNLFKLWQDFSLK